MQGFLQVFGLNADAHQYWYDSTTNLVYVPSAMKTTLNIRGLTTRFLITPNIVAAARTHYACFNLEGLPFENSNTVDDYW
jgi:leishmanolysin